MPARSNVLARANAAPGKVSEGISTTWIDDSMGALYAKLESLSILDDTLIVFIHDHGAIGKGTLYETGARIAMFARYPNYVANGGTGTNPFAAETFHDAIVSNIDLAPTFLHLATGSTKDFPPMDGSSLIDEIVRQEKEERTIFSELNKDRAAISTQWKYIRLGLEMYAGGDKNCQDPGIGRQASSYPGKSDTKQLYDLSKDGGEQDNVAKDTSTSNKMNGMLECHLKRTSIGSTDYETNCDDATPLISESQGVIGRETTWFVATVSFVAALWCVVA